MTEAEYNRRLPEFTATIDFYFRKNLGHPPSKEQEAGYLDWIKNGNPSPTGADIDAKLYAEGEAKLFREKPQPPPTKRPEPLNAVGSDLMRNGKRVCLKGLDAFLLYRLFRNGGPTAIRPFLDEAHEAGAEMLRVLFEGSMSQNGVLELSHEEAGFYDDIRPFHDCVVDDGFYLLGVAMADSQVLHTSDMSRVEHWLHWNASLGDSLLVFRSKVNEGDKNGLPDPTILPPGNGFWSQGSRTEDQLPPIPVGTFMEFHPRRLWPTIMLDTVASPVEIYKTRPKVSLFMDESAPLGDGNAHDDPAYAVPRNSERFGGHYAQEFAAIVFHNRQSQAGQLMTPNTMTCCKAFFRGATLA